MSYTNINKSSLHMNTKLWSGNGSTNAISGIGFQPDLVWSKARSGGNVNDHRLIDAVRGATKNIYSNASTSEETDANGLTAFNTDGFTMGNSNGMNNSSTSYVSWNWKAGNSAGSSNTDGSITSTVSANTTAGFSIVKYSGTGSNGTVGHGLGVAPKIVLVKNIGQTTDWRVYHQSIGNTKWLQLNDTSASQTGSTMWNDTSPTSSVFSIGTSGGVNSSIADHIAYCFAEKKGYSKFGSYTGNGNADGTFIYTGFAPAFFILKRTDGINSWRMWDNKRDPFNVRDTSLNANESGAEYTDASVYMDFLSNGVKFRTTGDNVSGGNYIYMAFGQSLVGSNNIPCTAR